ncbi:MAG: DUF5112 domain-containing protein [Prevotella sp.]|nr:DUF5112 domain-containing protein [Prevotella sp.]
MHVNRLFRYIDSIGCLLLLLGLFLSGCSSSEKEEVDRLNRISYDFHYKNIDSTYFYARKAFDLSKHYADGKAEALNNMAFVNVKRMNYSLAKMQLDSVRRITDNQVELLIADITQMRLCQRESENKQFYEYKEEAKQRIARINEDKSLLDDHLKQQLLYATSEYSINVSIYYYYLGLVEETCSALYEIDETEIQRDTAQWLDYMYQIGAGGIINRDSPYEIAQVEWDYLMRCYLLSHQNGYIYWEANALQAMSEHLSNPTIKDRLLKDNYAAMQFINPDMMPDNLLAGYLAQKSLELFVKYGDIYQIAGAYRTLSSCYWDLGDYTSSIFCLESALSNEEIKQAPDLVASIHERLSLTYSAVDNKEASDYHRNVYLDMQKKKRQNSELEARAEQLRHSSRLLNVMLITVILMILLVIIAIYVFDNLRKKKDRSQSLQTLLEPINQWKVANNEYINKLNERDEEVREEYSSHEISLASSFRRNIDNRAKIFLSNSIIPFIDRIIHEVNRLRMQNEPEEVRQERYQYIAELSDSVKDYNNTLTDWIQLRKGQLSLHIETFPVQELFDIVSKSKMSFQMKGITLETVPTEDVVKADKVLTLFMINTMADNARKFTPKGGTVRISSKAVDDGVEIAVSDTGAGMSPEQLSRIFDHKINNGHGFGLMNCKGIIESYKKISKIFRVCSIGAESEVGKGSRFFFRLPKGMIGFLLLLLTFVSWPCQDMRAQDIIEGPAVDSMLVSADVFADSAYLCNINHDYAKTMLFAESALDCINHYYHKYYSNKEEELLLVMYSTETPAEIQWYKDSVYVNYQTILSLRNEIAVAALALHDWDKYHYNNQVYTQLYKEIGIDNTLDKYVKNMQRSKINKNIAIIILILLLLALLVAYYMLYYRHQLFYRYYMDRVEEVNDTLLSDLPDEEKLMAVDKQLTNVRNMPQDLLQILKQIRETLQLSIHANNVKQIDIELAEDECRQLKYEEEKLHISNNVLDNCLSTLKHETMYYPSRIHQLVNETTVRKQDVTLKENQQEQESNILQSLDELVSYYKELYTLLSAQAMRQVNSVKIPCKVFHLEDILPRHCELQGDHVLVQGDTVSMGYLLEILQKQCGESKLVIDVKEKAKRYVELQLTMNKVPYRDFFVPKVENIPFMICRQIVRENSESTNLRGCGIVAEPLDTGTLIRITIAKNSIYESF